jgi:hypothetical protein
MRSPRVWTALNAQAAGARTTCQRRSTPILSGEMRSQLHDPATRAVAHLLMEPRTHDLGDAIRGPRTNPEKMGLTRAGARAREGGPIGAVRTGQSERISDPMADQTTEQVSEQGHREAKPA